MNLVCVLRSVVIYKFDVSAEIKGAYVVLLLL